MSVNIFGKVEILGKAVFVASGIPDVSPYSLWDFPNSSGTSLNNVNLSFAPSTTVQINRGDGSIEIISSDANYTHTFA
jgi:hypothetical protein